MTSHPLALPLAAAASLLLAGAALAQSADVSEALGAGADAAATPASASKTRSPSVARRHGRKRTSDTAMNTDAPAPTGPDTTTAGAGDTSDLSGSTGATEKLPVGVAPPSPAPPGGAASGGDVPNAQGGPHSL